MKDKYQVIARVGEGRYGKVCKARSLSGDIVALKETQLKSEQASLQGFPAPTLREIQFLQELKHPNIVRLREVWHHGFNVDIVLDYCEYDLGHVLRNERRGLDKAHVVCYMRQILLGLEMCHCRYVCHRDLKPSNIFLTKENEIRIGDFGLAKRIVERKGNETIVVTLWYRAPELLIGDDEYGCEIDMWSLGCILFEMITGKVLFETRIPEEYSKDEPRQQYEQLQTILRICGGSAPERWFWERIAQKKPDLQKKLKTFQWTGSTMRSYLERELPEEYKGDCLDLLLGLLAMNPKERWNAKRAFYSHFIMNPDPNYKRDTLPKLSGKEL